MTITARIAIAIIFLHAFGATSAWAQSAPDRPLDDAAIFNVVVENDVFAGTDRGYTNGIRFSWLSPETKVPQWARWTANNLLPLANEGDKRISLAIGQSMFAPDDLSATAYNPNDRPYAAWLYGSVGMVSDTGKTLDNTVMTIGMVGPAALGEPIQKGVHKLTDSPDPKGWANQIQNEPTINFTYERKWRAIAEATPFGLATDIIPHVGANLGTVNTSAVAGATARVGFDLPADYGPPRIRPSLPGSDFFIPTKTVGGYLFASAEQRVVAHNLFLDGSLFRDGPDAPGGSRPLVSSAQVGAALTWGENRLSYTHVFMTREFDAEAEAPQFGALTYSRRF